MNFLKSVFSDGTDEQLLSSEPKSPTRSPQKEPIDGDPIPDSSPDQILPNPNPNSSSSGENGAKWSFGGLLRELSTKSESVLETYRRDLKEFGSGLKQETTALREAAGRAVKELPASMEVAQGSLETVGHAIDEFGNTVWKSTAELVTHGKDALLASDLELSDSSESNANYSSSSAKLKHQISRYDSRVRAIQSNLRTYCEEPEDLEDFEKWKLGFVLEERGGEVEKLLEENAAVESAYKRVVPGGVDHRTFWCRYFYKIHRLKQAEDIRANLVKRAIAPEDEEDLRWDDEDDNEDEEEEVDAGGSLKGELLEAREIGGSGPKPQMAESKVSLEKGPLDDEDSVKVEEVKVDSELVNQDSSQFAEERCDGKLKSGSTGVVDNVESGSRYTDEVGTVMESMGDAGSGKGMSSQDTAKIYTSAPALKSNENKGFRGKAEPCESSKDGDFSVVSTQPTLPDEEDLEWDEIEDLASNNDKKASHGGSPNRTDLRRRLIAAEEEDLSWDIEDEDETVKA